MLFALPFPVIDPVLLRLGSLEIRWYALSYIVGLILGWLYCRSLARRDDLWGAVRHPSVESLDDLLVAVTLGVILGGRLGYVLFYNLPYFLAHPLDIPAVWEGGMSFHGGLIGAVIGLVWFARRRHLPILPVADLLAAAIPIGLLLGRLANFIKPELWGRPTDVAWGMVFPGGGPLPRHPSQLYEGALEGVVLFAILWLMVRAGAFRHPGRITGVFTLGYAVARIASEFFREPDAQLGFLFGGATMGMLLSLPVAILGLILLAWPRRAE